MAAMLTAAHVIMALGSAYLLTGAVVALAFLIFRLDRREDAAHGSYAFRALIAPGLTLLWPVVIRNWGETPQCGERRRHQQAHRMLWFAITLLLVLTGALTIWLRSVDVPNPPSIRIGLSQGALA